MSVGGVICNVESVPLPLYKLLEDRLQQPIFLRLFIIYHLNFTVQILELTSLKSGALSCIRTFVYNIYKHSKVENGNW